MNSWCPDWGICLAKQDTRTPGNEQKEIKRKVATFHREGEKVYCPQIRASSEEIEFEN